MLPNHLAFLADFLRRRSGLLLTSYKTSLIEGRLAPVARRFGFRNVESLLDELLYSPEPLARAVTEAMTTNDTAFFRDALVFQKLRDSTLPALIRSRGTEKRLRIWCAACSAGQEAYSVAMLLDDLKLAQPGWTIDLIATELNSDLVARAEAGFYTEFEVHRGLSAARLSRHFTRTANGWQVHDSLRRQITFRVFNLLDSFGWLYPVDLVLCRNVLLYFDQKTKADVLEKISGVLALDGALLLGRNESISGWGNAFTRDAAIPGFYTPQKRGTVLRFPQRLATA